MYIWFVCDKMTFACERLACPWIIAVSLYRNGGWITQATIR